jgi:hypothetical protein
MEQETVKKTRKSTRRPYRVYLLAVLAIILLGAGGYYGYKYYQENYSSPEAKAAAEAAAADAEKQEILAELSKLMVLPAGDPVLFKVNDEETMKKQQAFFKDTKNEDVLLVFQESSKAIIYRPSTKMIVNVGPINFDQNASSTSTQ